jgi:hypothetical protein
LQRHGDIPFAEQNNGNILVRTFQCEPVYISGQDGYSHGWSSSNGAVELRKRGSPSGADGSLAQLDI